MKGIYVLIIAVDKNIQPKIGSLGKINFEQGIYAYVGSAQNNLEKRIARHLSKSKNKFWHIDYLLGSRAAKIVKVSYKKSGKSEECRIAHELAKTQTQIPNFGCSDCTCKSHLFKIRDENTLNSELKKLGLKLCL
ncbi:MAG: GIY-YIG nuclease family protein [bacterium]